MRTFHDSIGREWKIDINVSSYAKVKTECSFDLLKLFAGGESGVEDLLSNPPQLVAVLWTLCEQQAEKAAITPEQFGVGFAGDSLQDAAFALIEATIDFFPNARKRALAREVVGKIKEVETERINQAQRRLQELTPEVILTLFNSALKSPGS